ncbi:MAG: hypothetical protein E7533_07080 [Ruminococcaceae bacterium]|nr:hypothetical protein [Oscillospiraceae bacterium]
MIIGAIICFIIAAIAIEDGESYMVAIFGGLGLYLIYRRITRDDREAEKAEKAAQRKQEEEKKRKEKVRQNALVRFKSSSFANQIIRDFRTRNWSDLDYRKGGCNIECDSIKTPYKTYVYIDYGLGRLNKNGCQELAEYIGMAYGSDYSTKEMIKSVGGYSGGYSGYVSSNGDISISRDADVADIFVGYKLYSKNTVPPPPPQGKAW